MILLCDGDEWCWVMMSDGDGDGDDFMGTWWD